MIYSDEDKISEAGVRHPLIQTRLVTRYLSGADVYLSPRGLPHCTGKSDRRFRKGFEGSQDYDLVLRLTEKTDKIFHIPQVLYSWRETESSTALNAAAKPYAHESGLKALNEHLSRRYGRRPGVTGTVEFHYDVRYRLPHDVKVSIIIPTRDKPGL